LKMFREYPSKLSMVVLTVKSAHPAQVPSHCGRTTHQIHMRSLYTGSAETS
jgi:hypothetical protein